MILRPVVLIKKLFGGKAAAQPASPDIPVQDMPPQGARGAHEAPKKPQEVNLYVERARFWRHYDLARTFATVAEEAMPRYSQRYGSYRSIGRDTFLLVGGLLGPRQMLDADFANPNLMQALYDTGVMVVGGTRLWDGDVPSQIEAIYTPQPYKIYRGVLEVRDGVYSTDVLSTIRKEGISWLFERNKTDSLIFVQPPYSTGLREMQVIRVPYDPAARQFSLKPEGGHKVTIKKPMNPFL